MSVSYIRIALCLGRHGYPSSRRLELGPPGTGGKPVIQRFSATIKSAVEAHRGSIILMDAARRDIEQWTYPLPCSSSMVTPD